MLLTAPISSLIPRMAVPTIISMLVMSFYNMADTFFVSSLGDAATGAVGVNMSVMSIIQMVGMALAAGANSFIARLIGANRIEDAERTLVTTFATSFMLGAALLVFGTIFMEPMLRLLGSDEPSVWLGVDDAKYEMYTAVRRYSKDYATYILLAAPFMTSQYTLNQCLRAEGSAALSMVGVVAGAVINLGLDPLFIFVFKWEVAGASAATAISQFISFCILLMPYLRRKTVLSLSPKRFGYRRALAAEVVKMGMPTLMRTGFMSVATIVTNNVAMGFSVAALAAISVVNRIMMFVGSAIIGYGQGYQPVAGFNWGAKRYDRVTDAFRFASITGVVVISVISLVAGIFAPNIMRLFSETKETIDIGSLSIRLQCLVMPVHAWVVVVNMTYAGLGKAVGAAVLSLARQGICFIPSVVVMSLLFRENGLASAQAVSDILSLAIAAPLAVRVLRELRRLMSENGQSLGKFKLRE